MKEFDLAAHLQPVVAGNGFEMPGKWVWCGSTVRGEDGKYHLFAACWSKERPFFSGYIFSSEVVHAVGDTPWGPFKYVGQVLPDRGEEYWDGRMTHNPTVHKFGDTYYLFYIGATYPGERPSGAELMKGKHPLHDKAYQTIRIGVATAKSVYGPWQRLDHPVLDVSPSSWDCQVVTNPAACFLEDGTILLYYRSNTPQGLRIGVARGHVNDLHFEKIAGPILSDHPTWSLEDHFVWHNGENFEMIAKDMNGEMTGIRWGGAHFLSKDGIHWQAARNPVAYSRTLAYADGSVRTLYHFERPCLLIENGHPICLYAAVGEDGDVALQYESPSFAKMTRTKNQAIRLESGSF